LNTEILPLTADPAAFLIPADADKDTRSRLSACCANPRAPFHGARPLPALVRRKLDRLENAIDPAASPVTTKTSHEVSTR
jgi:hypothetical protein